ncbi:TetR/AcrR family transcriptional regulator [Paracoccus sp. pheM1]|uniref:TetR/AcrR family transcriptional regulator n=1 Tax=Paracoccus sp. pheM1 TaxID=2831675 RepID=UPI001F0A46A7|nr:TetR/AcrR family transcriptional regulator [Paracoccus sp. pheM1]
MQSHIFLQAGKRNRFQLWALDFRRIPWFSAKIYARIRSLSTKTSSRSIPRRLSRHDRTTLILRNARAVIREKGFENFLPLEVAQRSGVSEGMVYKYFKSKRELMERVAEDWFEEFLSEAPVPASDLPLRDQLFQVIWSSLMSIKREPALTRFVLMELRADPNYRNLPTYQQSRRFAKSVVDVIELGIEQGAIRADLNRKLVRDMIFGAIEHSTWAFLRGEDEEFSVELTARGITDMILDGIRTPRPPTSELVERLEQLTRQLADELRHVRPEPSEE